MTFTEITINYNDDMITIANNSIEILIISFLFIPLILLHALHISLHKYVHILLLFFSLFINQILKKKQKIKKI